MCFGGLGAAATGFLWVSGRIAPCCRLSTYAKSYQQRARVLVASADGNSRPPSPQVDRREERPHLCTPRAGAKSQDTRGHGRHERLSGGACWAKTVGTVATIGGVAQPKLPFRVVAPALDGRVVLRHLATQDHCRCSYGDRARLLHGRASRQLVKGVRSPR